MPAEKFGRVWHLPHAQLAAVVNGMRGNGLIGTDDWLTADGRAAKARIEALTDELAPRVIASPMARVPAPRLDLAAVDAVGGGGNRLSEKAVG
jgi:hypothetical protein